MAVISQSTFDPLRRFVRVRLQQGVPIVDADVNEREDIQKFELRAFLKWFVGDGVPEGNDGFRIVGTGLANDFEIRSGVTGSVDPLAMIGRYLVDGLDVMIEKTVTYTQQELHESHGASAADKAAAWNVPLIRKMESIPASEHTILVHLDVWERLVTPSEDPDLIFAGLGTESCARWKREWVVRTRAGTELPKTGDEDFRPQHAYTPLALIARRDGDARVLPGDVTDLRQQRLLVPPANLIEDVLGTEPADYRRGQGRPPISLRAAINALLRGELPSTPDAPVAASTGNQVMGRAFAFDQSGGLVASWYGGETGGVEQVAAARIDLSTVKEGFGAPSLVTSGGPHGEPHLVALPGEDLLFVYRSGSSASADVMLKQAPLAGLGAAVETPVSAVAGTNETLPFVAVTGDVATIFFHSSATNRWQYRRWRHTDKTWADTAGAVELSNQTATGRQFHAAVGQDGGIWAAFTVQGGMQALRLDPKSGTVDHQETFANQRTDPSVLCTREQDTWVFSVDPVGVKAIRFHGTDWEQENLVVSPNSEISSLGHPSAVEDQDGSIWLVWNDASGHATDLFVMQRDPVSGEWDVLHPRRLTTSPKDDLAPFALIAPDNTIWIFWSSNRTGAQNVYYKRLITAV
ncbi:DUF6519 domain-containing protein [Streptomyces palmae]|uniref:Uncharacterized protein n=1 Tax=Streptomyces palmae TaxID=1701085 RepID=A0A4Z0GYT5_9ACTN|nr:DUF6519 domain-containing protein [Streptomyces palmae]TGB03155.1 hypothetical protein E4099_19975 [Streptomyces palmae]